MSIGPPQDDEGREIPLDTKRLYDADGVPVCIRAFRYNPNECFWRVGRLDGLGTQKTTELRFTPPDSWEKLEADLNKCIETDDSRWYCSASGICAKCTRPDNDGDGCTTVVFSDIKKRIRKLRGGDLGERIEEVDGL